MMHIPTEALAPTAEWERRAALLSAEIEQADAATRGRLLRHRRVSRLWSELKEDLALLSHEKCWYCESPRVREDGDVDHYRPKGPCTDPSDPHDGYWWLALDPANFRMSCTYCNQPRVDRGTRGGKHARFPLLPGGTRATGPDDDLALERPALLDPTDVVDPKLLTFDRQGKALAARDETEDPEDFLRADISIELLHLNQVRLQQRRREHCASVEGLINVAAQAFRRSQRAGTPEERARFEGQWRDELKLIAAMKQSGKPYSATVCAIIKAKVDTHPWLEFLLDR